MSEETSPHSPEFAEPSRLPAAAHSKIPWVLAAVMMVAALMAGFGYGLHQRNQAQRLAEQNQQVTAALTQTRSQMDTLNTKLNDIAAAQQAREEAAAREASSRRKQSATVVRMRRDDPRWKKVQSQLDAQGKAIDSTRQDLDGTRQDLNSAKTELGDSIARTHGELVLMQKKGERNYYEFDLNKTKQFARQGPVGIRLKKANQKNGYADLELMVDDTKLSQKHVNLFQPVVFLAGDNGQPVQLVINSVSKNHIHGYVSEPKYKASELAAAAPAPAATAEQPPQAPQARRRLPLKPE
jgi:hypothetical protein